MNLKSPRNRMAICRLSSTEPIPAWATAGSFFSVTRTQDELSIVCDETNVPENVKAERHWRCFQIQGPLDFALTGILTSLANPLAQAGISIFSISTFDTDYLLVREPDFEKAVVVMSKAGHKVES